MVYEGSEQLKILLVVEPGIDGVFRYVEGLAKFLIAKGHEVHLAYSDKRGSPDLIELVRYVDSKGFECLNLRVSNAPHISDVRALYGLRRLASRARPNVIHCHSSKAGVLGRTLALLGVRSRYFYTPHAYYGLSGTTDKRTTLYNHIEKFFGKIGTTINISNDERRFAIDKLRLRPDRTVLINNPVDSSRFVPSTPEIKRQIRESFGVPNDALVLGSMGRLSSQKDPQTLYEAFNLARQKIPEIYLLHVGQGELTREMDDLANQLQIRDRLIRIPYLNRPAEFYSAIDAIIMTSRYEAFWPLVILEAMACDLPVISGTGPGTSDIGVSGLSHCWTSPVGDVPSFSRAIEEWYRDIPAHRTMNHRDVALKRFSQEASFGAVVNLYRSWA